MKVDGVPYRSIWLDDDGWSVMIIDQTRLPYAFAVLRLTTLEEAAVAIRTMQVRGAPLIGATAAYGLALAARADASDAALDAAAAILLGTRPTAVNLRWAVEDMLAHLRNRRPEERASTAYARAKETCAIDVETNRAIGEHGLPLFQAAFEKAGGKRPLRVLTHCNAGWLATVDWGTALAPIYRAHESGMPLHVWVDETRPRNQGALTAWELGSAGVPHTVIVDNAGGHLMQRGEVDLCIVGTDRTTANGDVCNKIGTYLKALAAKDNGVPFYVGLPSSTIDWRMNSGGDVPIEQRGNEEVVEVAGQDAGGEIARVRIFPARSPAANYAFDVTPARLVSGLITERGICEASARGLASLFSENIRPKAG